MDPDIVEFVGQYSRVCVNCKFLYRQLGRYSGKQVLVVFWVAELAYMQLDILSSFKIV